MTFVRLERNFNQPESAIFAELQLMASLVGTLVEEKLTAIPEFAIATEKLNYSFQRATKWMLTLREWRFQKLLLACSRKARRQNTFGGVQDDVRIGR